MSEKRITENLRNAFADLDARTQGICFEFLEKVLSVGYSCDYVPEISSLLFTYDQFAICQIKVGVVQESLPEYALFFKPVLIPKKILSEFLPTAKENSHINKLLEAKEFMHAYNVILGDLNLLLPLFQQIKDAFFTPEITVDFRIESLGLKNFRCFKNETFHFNPQSTVLIGKNASGKTSVLEGITVAIGGFLRAIDEKVDKKAIEEKDVRFTSQLVNNSSVTNRHPPTVLKVRSRLLNHSVEWSRSRDLYESDKSSKTKYKESNEISSIVKQLVADIREEEQSRQIILPVFTYHGTGRVANYNKDMGEVQRTENISRFFAYKDCLKPDSNYKTFIAWYRKMKYEASEMDLRIPSLDAVTDILVRGLQLLTDGEDQRIEDVRYLRGDLHVKYSKDKLCPIASLSDGYQDFIGIISDIAFRMAVLNPQLGTDVSSRTPGIVLIDELDLHLHPKWQQRILYVLKNLFPKVQIISTTHSPVIISATEENEALELYQEDGHIVTKPIGNPAEWYISDILAQAFHIYSKPSLPIKSPHPTASLEDRLQHFSERVKSYVSSPNPNQKHEIENLYNDLLPSLPTNSPRRRAVDALKGLVK